MQKKIKTKIKYENIPKYLRPIFITPCPNPGPVTPEELEHFRRLLAQADFDKDYTVFFEENSFIK